MRASQNNCNGNVLIFVLSVPVSLVFRESLTKAQTIQRVYSCAFSFYEKENTNISQILQI